MTSFQLNYSVSSQDTRRAPSPETLLAAINHCQGGGKYQVAATQQLIYLITARVNLEPVASPGLISIFDI